MEGTTPKTGGPLDSFEGESWFPGEKKGGVKVPLILPLRFFPGIRGKKPTGFFWGKNPFSPFLRAFFQNIGVPHEGGDF